MGDLDSDCIKSDVRRRNRVLRLYEVRNLQKQASSLSNARTSGGSGVGVSGLVFLSWKSRRQVETPFCEAPSITEFRSSYRVAYSDLKIRPFDLNSDVLLMTVL